MHVLCFFSVGSGGPILQGESVQMTHKQPGLDGRHRDANGQITSKHGNTTVGTLRQTYGDNFAQGTRSDWLEKYD
jgi:hypothetical protein